MNCVIWRDSGKEKMGNGERICECKFKGLFNPSKLN